MKPIEQRLTDHLGEQAAGIEPDEHGVVQVMAEGRRKHNGRVALVGVAACIAVVGIAVASIAVFGRDKADSTITPAAPVSTLSLGLDPATDVTPNFDWSVETTTAAATQFGSAVWWLGASFNGLANYTFGTVPHQPDETVQQQLFSSTDGVEYQPVGQAFDPWITSLDSSRPDRVYAIGTVPAGLSYSYQTGVTSDEGVSWQLADLPIDLEQIRDDLDSVSTTGTQVVVGEGSAVAIVQPIAYGGTLTIDGIDTQYGTAVTDEGVEVFGPPDDLAAIGARECPPGWPLAKGAPREFVSDGIVTESTVIIGPGGKGGQAEWHCESPDRKEPDMWIDPVLIHGDATQVVPFDQLPFGDATVKALRNTVRVFRTTDGTSWTEVALPAGGSTTVRPTLLWNGSEFALRAPGMAGGELWLSADGETWQQAALPDGSDTLAFGSLPDGSFLLAGRQMGELVAYTSADGSTWTGVSLDALLGLDAAWRLSTIQLVTSPAGASLMVSGMEDPFAVLGPPVIDHGRYQLRLSDAQGGAELLDADGAVIDRLDNLWQGTPTAGLAGRMTTTATGSVAVVDPATGATEDVFVQTEINAASDAVWSSEQGQRFQNKQPPSAWWVLDTTDGSSWGISRVDGLSGVNSWLATSPQAIATTHSYRFMVGDTTAVVVGRRP